MHIDLYKPDIPQNTAAIIRLSACLNLKIHIIEPCGFDLHDKRFKRVVMDYLEEDKIKFYKNADDFFESKRDQRVVLITTKGIKSYTEFNFKISDTLLFGRESAGVPNKVHKIANEKLKIPMATIKRSLNLATSVGIVLAEQIRQIKN